MKKNTSGKFSVPLCTQVWNQVWCVHLHRFLSPFFRVDGFALTHSHVLDNHDNDLLLVSLSPGYGWNGSDLALQLLTSRGREQRFSYTPHPLTCTLSLEWLMSGWKDRRSGSAILQTPCPEASFSSFSSSKRATSDTFNADLSALTLCLTSN